MRFTFRAKLLAIVGSSAFALVVVIATSWVVTDAVTRQVTVIEEQQVPKLELGPELEAEFDALARAYQDSVAAHDADALEATKDRANRLVAHAATARDVAPAEEVAAMLHAIREYQSAAFGVSQRLMAREGGETVVEAIGEMQRKQSSTRELIKETTYLDRKDLAGAFNATRRALAGGTRAVVYVTIACLFAVLVLSLALSRRVVRSVEVLQAGFARFARGDFGDPVVVETGDELADVAREANGMAASLDAAAKLRARAERLERGLLDLETELRGDREREDIAARAASHLLRHTRAIGVVVYATDGAAPEAIATSGDTDAAAFSANAARAGTSIGDASRDDLAVLVVPLAQGGRPAIGVAVATFGEPPTDEVRAFYDVAREPLAIAIDVATSRTETRQLLVKTQELAERLAAQEEELRATNDELVEQQEELRLTNVALAAQAGELERQTAILLERNDALTDARASLEKKANELATVSEYKSQFLANMSHELRTPLNSMLLLSNLLAENDEKNLSADQIEYARTVHNAGKDLLALINQVLDLAKIEAGKVEIRPTDVRLADVADRLRAVFTPLAAEKGLELAIALEPGLPDAISTDRQRLGQILTNLVGNAIKFTDAGSVRVRVRRDDRGIAFAVVDTGIGIAADQRVRVFAPFEQVDAAADRRHGGTGLGLSIAREFAELLGGALDLESTLDEGSTFTLVLPLVYRGAASSSAPPSLDARVRADSLGIAAAGGMGPQAMPAPLLLVVDDDPTFAEVVAGVARLRGAEVVVAHSGGAGLQIARSRLPAGIILDVRLPDFDGWIVLAKLRADPTTRHIPVYFVSAVDAPERAIAMGARGFAAKPTSTAELASIVEAIVPPPRGAGRLQGRTILIVDDDERTVYALAATLRGRGASIRVAASGKSALATLDADPAVDAVLMDVMMPEMNGYEATRRLRADARFSTLPIVCLTAKAMKGDRERCLEAGATAYLAKPVDPERLLALLASSLAA